MKAVLKKSSEVTLDKETKKLIQEAELTIKKIDKKAEPFKEMQDDRRARAKISLFSLELLVGKVTIDLKTCTQKMINEFKTSNMNPEKFIVK